MFCFVSSHAIRFLSQMIVWAATVNSMVVSGAGGAEKETGAAPGDVCMILSSISLHGIHLSVWPRLVRRTSVMITHASDLAV